MSDGSALENVQDILPLSPTQEGMLFEILADPSAVGRYDSIQRVTLTGSLDPAEFERVFAEIALRTDVSRACFVHEDTPRPLQIIRTNVPLPFAFQDWRGCADVEAKLAALERDLLKSPVDLTEAPLMSAHLLQTGDAEHVLLWRIHHLVSDAWSARVTLEDVLARMNGQGGQSAGPAFRDHLVRQQSRDREADRKHFQELFDGLSEPTLLASEDPAGHALFAQQQRGLSSSLTEKLQARAREERVTLATLLFVGWALCLRRFTGLSDVCFGRVSAGRDATVAGLDRAVGPYLTVVPTRLQIDAEAPLRDLLQTAERAFNAQRHFEEAALSDALAVIQEEADARLPFDTLVSIQGFEVPQSDGSLSATDYAARDATGFPLALLLRPGEGLEVEVVHDENRLASDTVTDIIAAFEQTLESVAGSADGTPQDIVGLPFSPVSPALPAPLVHHEVMARAAETPEAIAINAGGQTVSYGQLYHAAAALAEQLKELGIGPGDIVPVAATRDPLIVVHILGVLYAGAAYAPIDPEYPAARVKQALQQIEPRVVLGSASSPGWEGELLQADLEASVPADFEPEEVGPDDLAYVIFTSGSTGTPKGVKVSHGNLAWSTSARAGLYDTAPEVFLHLSSFAFDSSVVGLYWTLCCGGTLLIAPPRAEQDEAGLKALIKSQDVSHLLCLPRIWEVLLESGGAPTSMRTVIVAGEGVPETLPSLHRENAPHVQLYNEYGPTEATVWCAASRIDLEDGVLPIGRAPPGAALDPRDLDGWRMPRGLTGELFVRGNGIAQGYLGLPYDGTEFVAKPERGYRTGDLGFARPDAQLVCLGRIDDQVKIRGHRVELGEIEAAARAQGAIDAAAAVRDGRIILAVSGAPDDLESAVKAALPAPLHPAAVHQCDSLPRLPNGKLDRGQIAELGLPTTAPQEETDGYYEKALADIWSDILKTEVGPATHFFKAGGDSLMTIKVVSTAKAKGLTLRPADLFDTPVLGELAAALRARQENAVLDPVSEQVSVAHPDGTRPPVLMIHGSPYFNAALAAGFGPDRPCIFNWSHHLGGELSIFDRIETLADQAIAALDQQRPDGPCAIVGYSLGGIIALEVAHRLKAAGRQVTAVMLVDPSYDIAPPDGLREEPGRKRRRWVRAGVALVRLGLARLRAADPVRRTGIVYRVLIAPYRPRAYEGACVVLENASAKFDSDALVAATPNAERVALPYKHTALLRDPDAIADVTARVVAHLRTLEKEQKT